MHVGFDGVDWLLDDQSDADGGRKVEDHVGVIDQLGEQRLVVHGFNVIAEPRAAFQMCDVVDRSGGQIVEDDHLMAGVEQGFRQMGADEAGSSRDQHAHASYPFGKAQIDLATSSMSASASAGYIGSDSTSPQAAVASGHSAGFT